MNRLSPDYWFQLHIQDRPRLWTPPPAAMETVVEVFNEDCLAHPYISHVFAIPRLTNHLWEGIYLRTRVSYSLLMWGHTFGPAVCMKISSC